MASDEEIEGNLLMFLEKSFGFERSARVSGRDYAVYARTETESESQFRPKLVRLRIVVPKDWVLYDLATDSLRIASDGKTLVPQRTVAARESAAEAPEFVEQGVEWRRTVPEKGRVLYVPARDAPALLTPEGAAELERPV